MKLLKYSAVLLVAMALWGCGKGNPAAPVAVQPGASAAPVHPAGWALAVNHGANRGLGAKAAAATGGGMRNCQSCHGLDFAGGISKVSCFNNANCHGANKFAAHPSRVKWSQPSGVVAMSHKSADPGNAAACFVCHKDGNNSSLKPTAAPVAGSQPGCFNNTLCHKEGAHTLPFPGAGHIPGGSFLAGAAPYVNCTPCHDTTTIGGTYPITTSPLNRPCSACHKVETGGVLHLTSNPGCGDCHGSNETGDGDGGRPNGAAFPNTDIAHASHRFPNVGTVNVPCSACHLGYGTGSPNHGFSKAKPTQKSASEFVVIDPVYKSKTGGAATYNATTKTCANVSCHEGVNPAKPDWANPPVFAFDDTNCDNCHTPGTALYTPQYNSYYSGRSPGYSNLHDAHLVTFTTVARQITCASCHDMSNPAVRIEHYSAMNAQGTINSNINSATVKFDTLLVDPVNGIEAKSTAVGIPSCLTIPGNGTTGCHGNHVPYPWISP